ncbi:major facilitator superfamily transporter [Teratosphaeria nubilosa]|uniref:Major facilitator superfamily transporter n=1 Tax=Teratosphaeria nubilosa TaxID=161662 RepID=A0A6G1KV66_9PEZI|nr:major facilitator superfamily transporter [Teratosphaeria nubilosa]
MGGTPPPEKTTVVDDARPDESAMDTVSLDAKGNPKTPWWSYFWDYEPGRSTEERKFVQRLDISVLIILSLGYFIKNLDQTNISNAYVSGMKEQLRMNGDQLNLIDVAWTTGYVVGQLPSQVVLTRIRPSIWIPSCELVWTILTFSIAATQTSNQVIAIRFVVGLVESIFYPAAHTILGAWYKPSELGKRACIFHASSAAASMFSGYLQAGLLSLDGVGGLPGWKWLFIMDGVISAPIALAGVFLIPDLPENSRAFYLSKDQIALAQKRMNDIGRAPCSRLGWSAWKRIFGRWHVYVLTILYIIFINTGPSSSINPFSLWLKAEGYSTALVNVIPTSQYAVQLVATVSFAFFSDYLRNRPLVMSFASMWGVISSIITAIWSVPAGAKWFAFEVVRAAVPYGPLAMSWANEICGADAEERTMVLGIMNASGYAFNAWLPLLTYPAKDAPRFRKGFIFSVCAFVGEVAITGVVLLMQRRELRKRQHT